MKRVNIQQIRDKEIKPTFTWQNAYGVWLDWGVTISFKNKKTAVRFRAYVNERLTELAFELNDVLGSLMIEYRRIYFNIEKGTEKELLWRLFGQAENHLNKITDKSERHGFSFSVINDFRALASLLLDLCNYFDAWYRKKQRYSEARQIAGLASRCEAVPDLIKEMPGKFIS